MSQCGILLDKFHECELEAMGFQLMFQEMDNCADCKCRGEVDEECLRKCSPRSLYERQMQKLLDNKWVDRKTRAVFLDVAIFYQNFNLFQVIIIIIMVFINITLYDTRGTFRRTGR
jgi:hypothetical protein